MMKAAADASERLLLVLVLVVAAVGLAAPAPGRALAAGNGIDATLAVLVFSTGLSLRLADLAAVRLAWRRVAVVLLVSTAALPALAWAASQLISDPVLRAGVQAAGVAPAEVATVALCVIAGGEAAVCATLLAASTISALLMVSGISVMKVWSCSKSAWQRLISSPVGTRSWKPKCRRSMCSNKASRRSASARRPSRNA